MGAKNDEFREERPIPRLDANGHEVLDSRPLAVPAGFRPPESLSEQVKRLVQREVSDAAHRSGFETFEEANDFDIEDDPVEPDTPFETVFDPVLGRDVTAEDLRRDTDRYREEYMRAGRKQAADALAEAAETQKRRSWWKRPKKEAAPPEAPLEGSTE